MALLVGADWLLDAAAEDVAGAGELGTAVGEAEPEHPVSAIAIAAATAARVARVMVPPPEALTPRIDRQLVRGSHADKALLTMGE